MTWLSHLTVPEPDAVTIQVQPEDAFVAAPASGVAVHLTPAGGGLRVQIAAPGGVSRVRLRWTRPVPPAALVLGDAWERSYGELEWRSIRAERVLPWTALVHDRASGTTWGQGVAVRGGALAFWQVDAGGTTLVLDLRSGSAAVRPGDRLVDAAVVHWTRSEDGDPFAAQRRLYDSLSPDPLLPRAPLVGANNWYYAYGKDFGLDAVVRDARMVSDLSDGHAVRPFGVIDDGWSEAGTADGLAASAGPWTHGRPDRFPRMDEAAAAIAAQGVRPGIWFRPLLTHEAHRPGAFTPRDGARALDPSAPEVLDLVEADVRRLRAWGFELIKHDFTTYDLLGSWGPDLHVAGPAGAPLHDPTLTTAEALGGLYRRIADAAGDGVVLGCNVVGHLAAGLVQAQRTGDDTSGLSWDRTRRVAVNTLAFRLAQHGTMFAVDPDCVPSTPWTDWRLNRQLLDLVARSGAALFVSVDPRTRTDDVDRDLAAALRLALDGGHPGLRPLDWLENPTPSRWQDGGEELEYAWTSDGADPFEQWSPAAPPP